jgi:hypothetical protein
LLAVLRSFFVLPGRKSSSPSPDAAASGAVGASQPSSLAGVGEVPQPLKFPVDFSGVSHPFELEAGFAAAPHSSSKAILTLVVKYTYKIQSK